MRHSFISCFCTLFVAGLFSCQSNDLDVNNGVTPDDVYVPVEGMLLDGGEISGINLFCIENNATMIGQQWQDYYAQTKTVENYDDFRLYIMVDRNASTYISDDTVEMNSILKLENEYYKDKSSFILDAYNEYEDHASVGWPDLFTAYVNGDVDITCSKELFGKAPGTKLNDYFVVSSKSKCIPVGIEETKLLYNFGDNIPSNMSIHFQKGVWLQPEYYLQFANLPNEKYDEITLYLSLPLTIEHSRDYVVAKYKGNELPTRYTESVFKAECTIKFDKK